MSDDGSTGWVAAPQLTSFTAAVLEAAGLEAGPARVGAEVLVESDLCGVESHGVSRMLGVYLEWLASGHANPRPDVRTVRGRGAVRTIDGDRGLGVATTPPIMDELVAAARESGMAAATIVNSRHLGMAGFHAARAIPAGMIGLCTTSVGPYMVPTFGREVRLGTNPIAVAVPCSSEPHFVFDGAMTASSANRVMRQGRLGLQVSPGLIANSEGTPLLVGSEAPTNIGDLRLLPLGSAPGTGSYKGYGLAAVVEILSSILGGAIPVAMQGRNLGNHWLCVLDIDAFTDLPAFLAQMDAYRDFLVSTPPAAGHTRVYLPGEIEELRRRERLSSGIPLTAGVLEALAAAGERLGVSTTLSAAAAPLQLSNA
jgi:L-2-hydroxycarboxylate dehydrogenase (NAD+)